MCWISNNLPVAKEAEKDKVVLKVLHRERLMLPGSNGEKSVIRYTSPVMNFPYTLGVEYEEKIIIEKPYYDYSINNGLHCYSDKIHFKYETENFDMCNYIIVMGTHSHITYRDSDFKKVVLMKCIIPKGTYYYENENGEIVSHKLKIIGEIPIRLFNENKYIKGEKLCVG